MLHKPLNKIDKTDIQALIDNKVVEGKTIEYKSMIPLSKDADKKEFLADVSSFANATGGDIIIGITENNNGEPSSINGIPNDSLDSLILQMESMTRMSIKPRIPKLEIKPIEIIPNNNVIVIRIPKSYLKPHQVIYKGSDKFYSRGSNGKFKLDLDELRDLFLFNSTIGQKIKDFRQERLSNIVYDEDILPLASGVKVALHLIPIQSITDNKPLDFSDIKDGYIRMPTFVGHSHENRYNFDGYIAAIKYSSKAQVNKYEAYTQIFRSGIIEAASIIPLINENDKECIPSHYLVKNLIKSLKLYFKLLDHLNIDSPIILTFSLINIKGKHLGEDRNRMFFLDNYPSEKNMLNFPIMEANNFATINIEVLLKDWLDMLWRTFGYIRCFLYDEDGNWIRK